MSDLFSQTRPAKQQVFPDVWLLNNFVETERLKKEILHVSKQSPFRKMLTPMGHYTRVPLTNCGNMGWVSDLSGYRYSPNDPLTQKNWPQLPEIFLKLAKSAAKKSGYDCFEPNTCLINHYKIGFSLGAHQDKNETDFTHPIVSVSIGLTATFQIFGQTRSNKPVEIQLQDGDVLVWGKSARLIYHGVKSIKADKLNPKLTERFNLTFRKTD